MSNFINNIKRIFNNIKYVLCYDFHELFNHINNKADKANNNILWQDCMNDDFKKDFVTLNKRIDFIHTKLQKYQIKDIDMMKIYIEENTEEIKTLENDIKDINGKALYQLRSEIYRIFGCMGFDMCANHYKGTIEQIKNQQEEFKTLQLFLMEYNHIFRKLKDK